MTHDQNCPTTAEIDAAVDGALRRYVRGSLIGFIVLIIGLGASQLVYRHDNAEARKDAIAAQTRASQNLAKSGSIIAVDGCNRDFVTTQRLRALLVRAQAQAKANGAAGNISEAQVVRSDAFYNDELRRLKLPDCRKAADIISTDNTDAQVPEPYYPGHGPLTG